MAALLLIAAAGFTSCRKAYEIQVPTNNLWFGMDAGSQPFDFTANCKWTITKNDDADWYTISTKSGENDATIIIIPSSVRALEVEKRSLITSGILCWKELSSLIQ